MPNLKTTPGPWIVDPVGRTLYIGPQNDHATLSDIVCTISYEPDYTDKSKAKRIANAHLIAAAPDLYAALQHIVDTLCYDDEEGLVEYTEQMIAARAALAKARGEVSQ